MSRPRVVLLALVLAIAAVLSVVAASREVAACGGFFTRTASSLSSERRPAIGREQVLIIHDEALGREHFIREVAFRRAREPFGFVVPTPTRPEVAKFERGLFAQVRRFFFSPPYTAGGLGLVGTGGGGGGARTPSGVTVLEQTKVGSFTAFVLAADDSEALEKWLAAHDLVTTPETSEWLAHYVRMGFYHVAMRYDPPQPAESASVVAETIRISFATPVPYYPYFEPIAPKLDDRVVELWVVGRRKVVPVALDRETSTWIRPMREGVAHTRAREELAKLHQGSLAALLPAEGELLVQTFQDQKRARAGLGDILFVPKKARELDAEQRRMLLPLLAVLDPALEPTPKAR